MPADRPRQTEPDPVAVVAAGYDEIAERYLAWSGGQPSGARLRALELADRLIPAGAEVLELGCGAGLPMTARLAVGRQLTGVDVSAEQIRRARENVPSASFVQADLTTVDRPAASLDAVVAFYALTHVPRERLPGLFTRELPAQVKGPGTWMHDALSFRDQWESRLLRTAAWSPLT